MKEIREGDKVIVKYPDYNPWEATVVSTSSALSDYEVSYNKDYSEVHEGQPDTVLEKFVHRYPPECEHCKTQQVYHDKKSEWFCPFCENDDNRD